MINPRKPGLCSNNHIEHNRHSSAGLSKKSLYYRATVPIIPLCCFPAYWESSMFIYQVHKSRWSIIELLPPVTMQPENRRERFLQYAHRLNERFQCGILAELQPLNQWVAWRSELDAHLNRRFSGVIIFRRQFDPTTGLLTQECHVEQHHNPYKKIPQSFLNDITKLYT